MATFEEQAASAVANDVVAGVVVIAKDKDGKLDYSKSFSRKNGTVYNEDTVLALASMSKLMTSVAGLQVVEKGLITLDEDVTPLLPSLAKQEILTGFADDGTPITRKRQNPITLRQLLTHSAGLGYPFMHEEVAKFVAWKKLPPNAGTVDEAFDAVLLYEPGEGYLYSSSIDRVGQVIEKVTGQNLEDYMRQNLWGPLGMDSTTFFAAKYPNIQARRVPTAIRRDPKGPIIESSDEPWYTAGVKEPFGGQGIFSSPADYMKLLYSLLVDDEKVLKKETAALMFQPQLSPKAKESLLEKMKKPDWLIGKYTPTNEYDWGVGGILVDGDKHEFRREGYLNWGGAANPFWFIDRAAGVCGVFGIQLLPIFDPPTEDLIAAFEKEVYQKAGKL
ncbi:beta-lactamase family protein [Hypoxylon trugodes]|uniref:beta-lactamase family protein n=1 Tax=Hypoxylon trugodes TaxID=326681 RepID=UPI00218CF205|nr:beta-lactamase family protein [Hypoxylon trugodes]KAI1388238.1 beta-lactamase family protein [Hypoxylon trugodes]